MDLSQPTTYCVHGMKASNLLLFSAVCEICPRDSFVLLGAYRIGGL